jgi:hypothetical protein
MNSGEGLTEALIGDIKEETEAGAGRAVPAVAALAACTNPGLNSISSQRASRRNQSGRPFSLDAMSYATFDAGQPRASIMLRERV